MQCEQVESYLEGYVKRDLPTYKLAWVAQHLAGCQRCQSLVRAMAPAPVAVSAGDAAPHWEAEAASYGVQRQVPRWVPAAAAALALLVLGAGAGALRLAGQRAAARQPQPKAAEPSQPVTVRTSYMSQLGVTATLESAKRHGSTVEALVWFSGRDLTAPPADSWLRVFDEQRRELTATVTSVLSTSDGIAVTARFDLPRDQDGFLLRFGDVNQRTQHRWLVLLPDPLQPPASPERLGRGRSNTVELRNYAVEGQLLRVHLGFAEWSERSESTVYEMRDGDGALYAPVKQQDLEGFGGYDVILHYPLPRELRPPFTITGTIPLQKQIGPWLLEGFVVE